ncbi:MAG: hypothetical protein A3G18_01365 [Rhodospirillales bacterium RIFCSPLOWO2_12_FULL_58_28]|nr:MAG: hypothetical protein A3H92_04565 [Rhodospirillales bacterium RIFCSPLOWO2_02_FULL_58_16]OHC78049.1 MAG: hypothetical protein A3G18_01365 [Rhodospirillales bacterium RIFCSPLOWO2_12_FULL_58_28]
MPVDPVCKMQVTPAAAAAGIEFEGEQIYFCSLGCRDRFLADPAYFRAAGGASGLKSEGHSCCDKRISASGQFTWMSFGAAAGVGLSGTAALLILYFGLLTLVSGWSFTLDQFRDFGPFIVALAVGFGIQVGLYVYLRRALHAAHSGKVVAVTGATSGAAMVSCCTHYLVNLLPALGAAGLVSLVSQYQIELFWFGLAANLAGIVYIARQLAAFIHADFGNPQMAAGLLLTAFIGAASLSLPASVMAQNAMLTPLENREGRVTVKVTPQMLSASAKLWQFQVVLDTHSVALDQDMLAVAVLVDSAGGEHKPAAWDGDPPGGHHRQGLLTFKPTAPVPSTVLLKIRTVGGVVERSFTWKLGSP